MARQKKEEFDFTKIPMAEVPDVEEAQPEIAEADIQPHEIAGKISHGLENFEDPDVDMDELANALKHPAAPPELLNAAYDRFFPEGSPEVEEGHQVPDGEIASKLTDAIISNPKAPKDIIERHARRTYHSDEHGSLGERTDLPDELLQELATKVSQSTKPWRPGNMPYSDLHPDFYFGLLQNRPIPEPVNDTMTEEQKATNNRAANIDKLFLEGLGNTKKHTPETLNRAVDFLSGEKPFGMSKGSLIGAFNDIVKHPNLTSDQIDRLYDIESIGDEDSYPYTGMDRGELLDHPNASPSLLARVALSKPEGWARGKERDRALRSPKLPEATRKKAIKAFLSSDESDYGAIAHNPSLDSEDLLALYSKRPDEAAIHPNAPEDLVRKFHQEHRDDLDDMRKLLGRRSSVPKDVLIDLVNHKNQELAESALNHSSADIDVVNAGLKRKAAKIKQAAMRHPLVASKELMKGLEDGRISGFDLLQPHNINALGGKLPESAARMIDSQYSLKDYNSKEKAGQPHEDKQKFWAVKDALATRPDVPSDVRAKNVKDIASHFVSVTKPGDASRTVGHRGTIGSQLGSYVALMAKDGNQDAQAALLERPGFMNLINMSSPTFSQQYIDKAYDAVLSEQGPEGEFTHTEPTGHEWSIPAKEIMRQMANNPNASERVFDQITLSPDFLGGDEENITAEGQQRSRWGRQEAPDTVFDKRYGHLPEDQRRAGFQKILNNPLQKGAKRAVLVSTTAPSDLWRSTFESMPLPEQKKFLSANSVAEHGDPLTFKEALMGKYNAPRSESAFHDRSSPQQDALADLEPGDKQLASEALVNLINNDGDPEQVSPKEFASSINKGFLLSEAGDQLIREANQIDPKQSVGAFLAARRASELPAESAAAELIKYLNDPTGIDPANVDSAISNRWGALVMHANNKGRYDSDRVRNILNIAVGVSRYSKGTPNGALDFLTDLDQPGNISIGESAVAMNLISPQKIEQLAATRPEIMAAGMKRMDHGVRARLLSTMADSGKIDHRVLEHLAPILNSGIFVDKGYGSKFSSEMYAKTRDRVFQFADAAAASDPEQAAVVISRVAGVNPEEQGNKMPVDYRKTLVKEYVDHVFGSAMPDTKKYQILGSLYQQMDQLDASDIMPPKLQKHMADEAVRSGNVPALVGLIGSRRASPAVLKKAVDLFEVPQNLSVEHMVALGNAINSTDLTVSSLRTMVEGALTKSRMLTTEEMRYGSTVLQSMAVRGASQALRRLDISADDVRYYGAELAQLARSDNQSLAVNATDAMMNALHNDKVAHDQKTGMFAAMPDQYIDPRNFASIKDKSFITSSETIELATTPNKLGGIMRAAQFLNSDQIDTITSRAFRMIESMPEWDDSNMLTFSMKLMQNQHASDDQSNKVFRSVGGLNQYRLFSQAAEDCGYNNKTVAAANILMDQNAEYLNMSSGEMDGSIVQRGDNSHVAGVALRLKGLGEALAHVLGGESKGERKAIAKRFLDQVSDLAKIHDERSKTDAQDSAAPHPGAIPLSCLIDMVDASAHDFFDVDDFEKVLEIGKISEEYKKRVPAISVTQEADLSGFMVSYINRFAVPEPKLLEHARRTPELLYAMSERSALPSSVFMEANLEHMFKMDKGFGNIVGSMVKNTAFKDSSDVQKVYDKLTDSYTSGSQLEGMPYTNAMVNLMYAAPDDVSYKHLKKTISMLSNDEDAENCLSELIPHAVESGAGGKEFINHLLTNKSKFIKDNRDIRRIAENGTLDAKLSQKLVEMNPKMQDDVIDWMSSNQKVDRDGMSYLSDYVKKKMKDSGPYPNIKTMAQNLTRNKNIDPADLKFFYDKTKDDFGTEFKVNTKFHPALLNPEHGGDLFRDIPVQLPKSLKGYGLSDKNLVKRAEYSQARSRIKQAMSVIPPGGIDWATFKKANPRMEMWPEVKSVFMAKNNRPIMPEDMAEAARTADASEFHVTYTSWSGAQRHRSDQDKSNNLVVQLNTSKSMEQRLAANPKLLAFFQFIQNSANHTQNAEVGGHPVTPHIAAWVRVDVGGGDKGWIIEELQSDFSQRMHKEIDALAKQRPTGMMIGEHRVTPEEMHKFNDEISDIIKGWYQAGFQAVEEMARRHGVSNLYMHGLEVRASLSGFDEKREYPAYIKEMYDKYPRASGWQATEYTSYPVKSDSFAQRLAARKKNSNCWKKKLT